MDKKGHVGPKKFFLRAASAVCVLNMLFVNLRRFLLPIGVIMALCNGSNAVREMLFFSQCGVTQITVVASDYHPESGRCDVTEEWTVNGKTYRRSFENKMMEQQTERFKVGYTRNVCYFRNNPESLQAVPEFDKNALPLALIGFVIVFAGLPVVKGYVKEYIAAHKMPVWFTAVTVCVWAVSAVIFIHERSFEAAPVFWPAAALSVWAFVFWFFAALTDDIAAILKK